VGSSIVLGWGDGGGLLRLRRFMCVKGMSSRIQSGSGEQIVPASKQLPTWDFDIVLEEAERKGMEYHLVSTGGQHLNGLAEQMIGILKKQMLRSFEGRRYFHEEVCTLLQETAHVVNSRMLYLSQG
jgi:hypothetical protein